LASGENPIEVRKAEKAEREAALTSGPFADALAADLSQGFRSAKHQADWSRTLNTFAAPLRGKRLDDIHTDDVLAVLTPIWQTKHETASRLRGRIERVLDATRAKGLRSGENPARWRGHLDHLMPKRLKVAQPHHAAMPYSDVPALVVQLRAYSGVASRALEFLILTAGRTGEVLEARWDEIDLATKVWTVPPQRMKAGCEHRVPLSSRALELLAEMQAIRMGDYVFPGLRRGRPLGVNALKQVLLRMKVEDATVHGFRSSFRDWAGEATAFPREVAEAALAHVVGDETERAYRRGDALEKRRKLMEAWAGFLSAPKASAAVVPLARKRAG
jgi:integrase